MSQPADAPGTQDLAAHIAAAWEQHGEQAPRVAQQLMALAPRLTSDAAAADAIGLAEHVWLSHLNAAEGLRQFLDALALTEQAAEPARLALRRAQWVLGRLAGQAEAALPTLPQAARWRALQNLWTPRALAGHSAEVQAELAQAVAQALASDDLAAVRGLAATCNNLATDLRCGPRGQPALDGLMLALAVHARSLWGKAGTWLQAERAEYQLARCHAVLGLGAAAVHHAQAGLTLIDAHADDPQADALERCFAHEALAWAHLAAGGAAAAAQQLARMAEHFAAIADEDARAWARPALQALQAAVQTAALNAEQGAVKSAEPRAHQAQARPAAGAAWRRATPADLDALTPLFDAYRQFYDQPADLSGARRFLSERMARQDSVVLIATGTGPGAAPGASDTTAPVLGFCQLYPGHCSVAAQPVAVLYDLYVLPQARRSGVGRQLLQAAEALARQQGWARLDLSTARTNRAAQAAYESLGWARDELFYTYSLTIAP